MHSYARCRNLQGSCRVTPTLCTTTNKRCLLSVGESCGVTARTSNNKTGMVREMSTGEAQQPHPATVPTARYLTRSSINPSHPRPGSYASPVELLCRLPRLMLKPSAPTCEASHQATHDSNVFLM